LIRVPAKAICLSRSAVRIWIRRARTGPGSDPSPRVVAALGAYRRSKGASAKFARALDPLVGSGGFDYVRDMGADMPMRVISEMLGIPEGDQEVVRDRIGAHLQTDESRAPSGTDAASPGGQTDDAGRRKRPRRAE
jgi:cytochrome P450